jgi:hypothetical protein
MSIPQTYEEWKYCITQRCQIKLSPVFIQERLEKLADQQEAHTREYIRLYGEAYYPTNGRLVPACANGTGAHRINTIKYVYR